MVLTPATLKQQSAAIFREISNPTRWIQSHRPHICPFHQLIEHVPVGSHILDVGCGSGLWMGLLWQNQRLAGGIGFDSNAKAIAHANVMQKALTPEANNLQFIHLDARADWPRDEFNVASMIDVMHHVPPAAQQAVFQRLIDAVKPGGRIVYKDMARRPRWSALMNRMHDLVMVREWIHYRAIEEVKSWGETAGLTLLNEGRKRMWWYTHEWLIFQK